MFRKQAQKAHLQLFEIRHLSWLRHKPQCTLLLSLGERSLLSDGKEQRRYSRDGEKTPGEVPKSHRESAEVQ